VVTAGPRGVAAVAGGGKAGRNPIKGLMGGLRRLPMTAAAPDTVASCRRQHRLVTLTMVEWRVLKQEAPWILIKSMYARPRL